MSFWKETLAGLSAATLAEAITLLIFAFVVMLVFGG